MQRGRGRGGTAPRNETPVFVSVRIVAPPARTTGELWRMCWCTPYGVQTIVEDALNAGPGACLEACVLTTASDAALDRLESQFLGLRERHIAVSIRRDERLHAAHESIEHGAA